MTNLEDLLNSCFNRIKDKVTVLLKQNNNIEQIVTVDVINICNELSFEKKNDSLNCCYNDQHSHKCVDIEFQCYDLISWLKRQESSEKVYWNDSVNSLEIAGVGIADLVINKCYNNLENIFHCLETKLSFSSSKIRYYGGLTFSNELNNDSRWKSFGAVRFFVPRFELIKTSTKINLSCNFLYSPNKNVEESLGKLKSDISKLSIDFTSDIYSSKVQNIISEFSIPNKSKWNEVFINIIDKLNSGFMSKIVMARKKTLNFSNNIDGCNILHKLKKYNPKTIVFGIQPDKSTFFLGATPECLYERCGNKISSHAIAGTRLRGDHHSLDCKRESELLNSAKELDEHLFVQKYFENSFKHLCSNFSHDKTPSVLKVSMLQHLYCEFSGTLYDDVKNSDIIQELHPSPAVGGCPKSTAIDLIKRVETFDRGLYASPIGWFSKNDAKFAVGIRSALIQNNSLSIYAGAGIIKKSDPEKEWQEIEHKFDNFTRIFE